MTFWREEGRKANTFSNLVQFISLLRSTEEKTNKKQQRQISTSLLALQPLQRLNQKEICLTDPNRSVYCTNLKANDNP